jgi:hypothetical protein
MGKQIVVHAHNGVLFNNKTTDPYKMSKSQKYYAKWKEPGIKDYIIYCTFKILEKAKL